jgi:phosphohistidine phosphatase
MKAVYLLRHGKSKRGPQYATDYERPLAKRGKRDAARMGEYLAQHDMLPDVIVSSPAERARDTAVRLADAADYQGEIRFEEALYLTDDEAYLELIWDLDDTIGSVMFIGHNPATESVIETLSGQYARMPTAACARIDYPIERWRELDEGTGQLVWVQLPREL